MPTISYKENDQIYGKGLKKLLDFKWGANVLGAIVWVGVDGFGRRGRSTVYLERLMMN